MSDSVGLPGATSPAPSVGLPLPPVSPNGNGNGNGKGNGNSSSPPSQEDPASPPSPNSDSAPPPSPPAPPPDTPPPASSPPPEQSPPPSSTPPPSPNAPPPTPDSPPPSPDAPPPSPPSPPPNDSPPPAASTPPPTPEDVSPPAPPKQSESPNSPPPPPEKPNSPPPSSSPPPPSSPESSPTKPGTPPPSQHIYSPPPPPTPVHAPSPKASPTVPGATGPTPSHLPPHDSISKSSSGQSNPAPADSGNGGGGYQQRTMVGMAVAGVVIVAFIAMVFVVRRRKKRHTDVYTNSQYFPTANFSIKSDGYYYGPNPHMAYSGQGGGPMYNSQQPSMAPNSFGSQRGYMASGGTPDSSGLSGAKTNFSYEELMEITNGFSRHNILGEGGFGCVYKGTLQDGKLVAVKQLKAVSGQGDGGFKAEVEIISRVHHRHLVSLVGYCISDQHKLLIYEFVSNQTLEHHLHSRGMPVLEWAKRVKIAIGSAKGLAYLHEDCHPKIIHRDIKSANILLDEDFEAQVADFGLARLNDTTQTHVSTRVMGTFGYMAPEYASSGKLTDRSDVFSFGVVLLELITGRKPVDPDQPLGEESLVEWARPLLLKAVETGEFSELVDSRLEKHYVENEVFRMIETAAACVRHSAPKRPRMVQVVRALDCEGEMSDISNGVKVGQSMAYDSGQYSQDIMKFRQMAFGFDDTSDSGMLSGDHSVRSSQKSPDASTEFTAINRRF